MPNNSKSITGVKVPPPITFIGFFLVGYLLDYCFPFSLDLNNSIKLFGIVLVGISFPFAFWAMITMKTKQTPVSTFQPTTSIIKTGPFRFARNPMYVALVLLYLGLVFWLELFWCLFLLPIVIAIVHYKVILKEEQYLATKFGKEYLDYKNQVKRWGIV